MSVGEADRSPASAVTQTTERLARTSCTVYGLITVTTSQIINHNSGSDSKFLDLIMKGREDIHWSNSSSRHKKTLGRMSSII